MKKLYLHIGWRKTGSSAIQHLITKNIHDGLFLGIRVPASGSTAQKLVTGGTPIAHHGLANDKKDGLWEENWDGLASEVSSGGDGEYLVSSEIFSFVMGKEDGYIAALARKLKLFDEVVVFCWLRRQDQFMNSLRVQKAKHGGVQNMRKDHVKRFPPDGLYHEILEKLSAQLPHGRIMPFAYSRNSDIEADFLHAIGRTGTQLAADTENRINASMSPDMFRLQLMANAHFQDADRDVKEMEKLLVRAWDGMPADFKRQSAMPMTIAERKIIVKHFEPSNIRLCSKYGLDRTVFVPSEAVVETEPEYNIPDVPSPALVREMIAQVAAVGSAEAKVKTELVEFLSGL